MIPRIDGKVHHFEAKGLYDGLSLLIDYESETWWDHVTGEAVYGPLAGARLPIFNLLHSTVEQTLAADPDIRIAISDREFRDEWSPRTQRNSRLSRFFQRTLGREDDRIERMDIGIGVWTDQTHRYYSMVDIDANDRVLIDEIDGRRVLVYVTPMSNAPVAVFTSATSFSRQGDEIRLDTGEVVRQGTVYDANGEKVAVERPLQTFTRWYGFSLTFPGAEVYGR